MSNLKILTTVVSPVGTSQTSAFLIMKGFWASFWRGFPKTTGLSVSSNLYFGQETLH